MNWSPWAFLLLFCGLAAGQPYVSIVAPRAIRPNSEYHVAVTIHNASEPHITLVEVSGQLDRGGNFTESKLIVVQPNFTGILNFTIDDVGPDTYELWAQAFNGSFETSTKLKYVHKSYSVFTQTDRAVYKPGDKIRFRSVVLDSRLKPNVNRQLDVYITDGKSNRVKEWNNQNLDNGIYSGELELSQSPVLGNWTINANINNQTYKTGIQVDEYVLPEFKVTITSPPLATYDGKIISVTVNAKYTYGKPVKGEATVKVSSTFP